MDALRLPRGVKTTSLLTKSEEYNSCSRHIARFILQGSVSGARRASAQCHVAAGPASPAAQEVGRQSRLVSRSLADPKSPATRQQTHVFTARSCYVRYHKFSYFKIFVQYANELTAESMEFAVICTGKYETCLTQSTIRLAHYFSEYLVRKRTIPTKRPPLVGEMMCQL
jgi:hypothetical protein